MFFAVVSLRQQWVARQVTCRDLGGVKSVAVLGASADRGKFGNKAVRAYQQRGFRVFPINPHAEMIEGMPVFRSLAALPERPDLISVYLPSGIFLALLPEVAAKGCNELWLNPGADEDEVVTAARALGLNVIQACSIVAVGASPDMP